MGKKNVENLLIAGQLATLAGSAKPRCGGEQAQIGVLTDGAVAFEEGRIVEAGPRADLEARYAAKKVWDFSKQCVTPGLVDPHTHLVFAGSRERDFYDRIAGVSYEEIARRGGGIRESVRHLRAASRGELMTASLKRLRQMLAHGTTTAEVKSGYGLNLEDEVKTLEVAKELAGKQPIDLITTFLGAHEVPDEFRSKRGAYIDLLCNEILPQIAKRKLARYCDIFCEKDVFNIDESRRILTRARELGFELKLHADELAENFGGAELAAELGAVSADHLVMCSKAGVAALAKAGTIAVLLPATTFFLAKERFAPARALLDAGAAVALATDLNPGSSNTESLQVVATIAAVKLKMTAEEILTAMTHNAACAIGIADEVGRLAAGLKADLVVWDLPDYRLIPYHFGGNRVAQVFKSGSLVFESPK